MTEFTPGTKVHVEFDAIVEKPNDYDYIKGTSSGLHANSDYESGFLKVRDTENCLYHYVWATPNYVDGSDHLISVIVPPDWEKHGGAQVGDIWEANGREYFAYASSWGFRLTLFPVDGTGISYFHDTLDEFAELNPRLVRRRGEAV